MVVAFLMATGAQVIFDQGALNELFPAGVLQQAPWLLPIANWRVGDPYTLALWAALTAGLTFGLVAPPWPIWQHARYDATAVRTRAGLLPGVLATVAFCMVGTVALVLALGLPESSWMQWVWLVAIAALIVGATGASRARDARSPGEPRSGQGWLLLLAALLAVTALLVGWQGVALPVAVDRATARSGLAAATLLTDPGAGFFSPSRVGAPGLAYAPLALLLWLTQDGLLAVHLLAGGAALLLVAAVWLLASELFQRPDESSGSMALLAAGLTAVALPLLYFGRATPGLAGVSVAVLSAWLLLRGLRSDSLLALAASGMLAGVAGLMDRSCLVAPVILGLWWLGAAVLRPPALVRLRWGQWVWWLAGLFVIAGPVLGVWLREPATLVIYARGLRLMTDAVVPWPLIDYWSNLRNSFLGLMWLTDNGIVGFPGHLVHSLAAPLLWLAAGVLLVNLDRFVGWALATWLLTTLLFASATTILAPDWMALLLLLPGIGLALAFVLDRFFAAWRSPVAGWVDTSAIYLALGLLVAIGFNGAIANHAFAATNGDTASYIGRSVRTAAPNAVFLVANAGAPTIAPTDDVVRFLALPNAAPEILDATELPPSLPPQSHLLILPADQVAQDAVRTRYPGGVLTTLRDLHANPRLIVYRLP